ncbi:leucyl/phenylalanyl-tRNA--protein transferase [Chromatocurvus halotolerans]|uniref:Leucyl/phenylalanyl-tRNA--protein transferase n=1 Tax=Chromatocurvus halotolerans TaxID=1132028 RepID=A0A4R2KZB2_9GAMM|nr:leucyl/phenylalanyl-tRNA--protein transferase [Chromatocurvus halotolerans]TCO78257.1 leucyl/phenylalanyl-tRNA--protein transferase [Chromatocurvus halotolerans]
MTLLQYLGPDEPFPPTATALEYPNGLLAVTDDLAIDRLIEAYRRGIFPWFEDPQPVLWWSPDPRSVLPVDGLHVSRSLRRTLRQDRFRLSVDTAFAEVMHACAGERNGQRGTWINQRMLDAYCALHRRGCAHSIEVRDNDGELVGGLYGVALGGTFFGESMFSRRSDASKVALVALLRLLERGGARLVDCQVESDHLNSMGARNICRTDFEQWLARNQVIDIPSSAWHLPDRCGELL